MCPPMTPSSMGSRRSRAARATQVRVGEGRAAGDAAEGEMAERPVWCEPVSGRGSLYSSENTGNVLAYQGRGDLMLVVRCPWIAVPQAFSLR
jgi:hypothetical protein